MPTLWVESKVHPRSKARKPSSPINLGTRVRSGILVRTIVERRAPKGLYQGIAIVMP